MINSISCTILKTYSSTHCTDIAGSFPQMFWNLSDIQMGNFWVHFFRFLIASIITFEPLMLCNPKVKQPHMGWDHSSISELFWKNLPQFPFLIFMSYWLHQFYIIFTILLYILRIPLIYFVSQINLFIYGLFLYKPVLWRLSTMSILSYQVLCAFGALRWLLVGVFFSVKWICK